MRADFAASLVGTEQEVFVEEHNNGVIKGVTSNFQQVLLAKAPCDLRGLIRAKITHTEDAVCYAEKI